MKYPLPPSLRLRKGWEFDQVFRTGFRVQGELVRLLCLQDNQNSSGAVVRVGVAVGKRQCCSCGRSRGKRVLREAMRRILPWVLPGMKIVATLKDCALNAKADAIYFDALKALQKRKLLLCGWSAKWE